MGTTADVFEEMFFLIDSGSRPKVFSSMDPEFKKIFMNFVENGQIDVYPAKGKYSGAFAIHNLITQPSYVLLNWTDRFEDVRTLAHEFGHAINFELIRKEQNAVNFDTQTSVTEVASTFFEDFVLEEVEKEAGEELKLTLMVKQLNDAVSTIFRQIAFYNFETELHNSFREKGYLSKEEIGKLFRHSACWNKEQRSLRSWSGVHATKESRHVLGCGGISGWIYV